MLRIAWFGYVRLCLVCLVRLSLVRLDEAVRLCQVRLGYVRSGLVKFG